MIYPPRQDPYTGGGPGAPAQAPYPGHAYEHPYAGGGPAAQAPYPYPGPKDPYAGGGPAAQAPYPYPGPKDPYAGGGFAAPAPYASPYSQPEYKDPYADQHQGVPAAYPQITNEDPYAMEAQGPPANHQKTARRGMFIYNPAFENWMIRKIFIAKVFGLLTIMFTTVGVMCLPGLFIKEFRNWMHHHFWIVYVALVFYFVLYLTLACCGKVRKTCPINIIVLSLFTISTGVLLMFITSTYAVESVLMCLAITVGCSFVIIIVAATCPFDITGCGLLVMMLSLVMLVFGIVTMVAIMVFNIPWLYTIYAGVGALVMMFYLAFDVQVYPLSVVPEDSRIKMIMGGRKNEISPDEYIFAALELFIDIINLFLMILGVAGSRGE